MNFDKLQGFIFDFDGTIINSHPALIGPYKKGFAAIGRECDSALVKREMHFALRQMVTHFDMTKEEGEICADIIRKEIENPEEWHKATPFEDVKPVLEALKAKGKHLAILSGSRDYHIREIFEYCGIDKYFDFIVGGELNRPSKPNPAGMYLALEHWPELSKQEVIYIGDSLQDPETAENAGIAGCLIDRSNEFPSYTGLKIESLWDLIKM